MHVLCFPEFLNRKKQQKWLFSEFSVPSYTVQIMTLKIFLVTSLESFQLPKYIVPALSKDRYSNYRDKDSVTSRIIQELFILQLPCI